MYFFFFVKSRNKASICSAAPIALQYHTCTLENNRSLFKCTLSDLHSNLCIFWSTLLESANAKKPNWYWGGTVFKLKNWSIFYWLLLDWFLPSSTVRCSADCQQSIYWYRKSILPCLAFNEFCKRVAPSCDSVCVLWAGDCGFKFHIGE